MFHQGHDFQRTEYGSPGQGHGGRAGEVQMVAGADDAAGQENGGRQQGGCGGDAGANQPQPHEEKRDNGGGKNLEEAFDPEMNDPPAPILDD
jgi:hypothetical protein